MSSQQPDFPAGAEVKKCLLFMCSIITSRGPFYAPVQCHVLPPRITLGFPAPWRLVFLSSNVVGTLFFSLSPPNSDGFKVVNPSSVSRLICFALSLLGYPLPFFYRVSYNFLVFAPSPLFGVANIGLHPVGAFSPLRSTFPSPPPPTG